MSNFLIVGLGLLGGSYAKALKAAGHHILAIDVDMAAIDYALEQEIIDEGSGQPDEYMIGRADAAVFALYPGIFKDWIRENQRFFKPGIYITDVTGVKENVVYEIQDMLRKDVEYIPAHPMAGREVGGVINSDAAIFRGANYIVTPTEKNTPEAIEWCTGRLCPRLPQGQRPFSEGARSHDRVCVPAYACHRGLFDDLQRECAPGGLYG